MRKKSERRLSQRYKLGLELHYRISDGTTMCSWSSGITYDMSISGVTFWCGKHILRNTLIEIVVDWPVKQDNLYPIVLHAAGQVVRSHDEYVAVRIAAYRMVAATATTPWVNAASSC